MSGDGAFLNPARGIVDYHGMGGNLDETLLRHWEESQCRQRLIRRALGRSSLAVERFEGWALELIGDALSARNGEEDRKLISADTTCAVEADDR